jgi:hypothetical protein
MQVGMKKKQKRESESKKRKAAKAANAGHRPVQDQDHEKSFDFGGLPDRDLKKNLGCG